MLGHKISHFLSGCSDVAMLTYTITTTITTMMTITTVSTSLYFLVPISISSVHSILALSQSTKSSFAGFCYLL